jgi:hypothetical protein
MRLITEEEVRAMAKGRKISDESDVASMINIKNAITLIQTGNTGNAGKQYGVLRQPI